MKAFKAFVEEGKVVKKHPDPSEARSLFAQAKARLEDLRALPLGEANAPFRFEDAYEALREAVQAFLSLRGYKPYSHEAVFAFALEQELLPEGRARTADRYREIRNDISYRGKRVTVQEAEEILAFVGEVMPFLERKFLAWKE